MEGLAPPLKCLIEIRSAMQNGETARAGLSRYLSIASHDDQFQFSARAFLFAWDQGHDWRSAIRDIPSPHRRALLELVAAGLAGQPILAHLTELKSEIETAADLEIRDHMEMLPLKMLFPLLLLQFPAFMTLLFGPLLSRLLEDIGT